jgi:hypothetical protein
MAPLPILVAGTPSGRRLNKKASSPFFEKKGPKKLYPFKPAAAFPGAAGHHHRDPRRPSSGRTM